MKKTTKKLFTAMCSFAAMVCLSLGGAFAFSQTASVQASDTLAVDFTNDGQFSVSKYNDSVPFEYVDGASEGLPAGYDGSVLKITTTGGVAYATLDFSASKILAERVESIVVRMYSPGYTSADEFRTYPTQIQYGAGAYDASTWCDITLNANSMADMTDANGYLSAISLGMRVKGGASVYYIDSVTVNMTETVKVSLREIHLEWNCYSYDNSYCTFLQFNGGISGNGNLDANFNDLLSKMTIDGAAVDTNNISFYCPNWIGADGGIVMRAVSNPAAGAVMVLPKGATFDIGGTDSNVYEIERDIHLQFNGTKWEVYAGVNYNPDFLSIGELNHVYSDGLDAYGVSLMYDTTGFEAEGMHTALGWSGFSLNGEDIGVALWNGNQVLLWLPAGKCVDNYNGYSHPTIVIAKGAKVTNTAGKEFTLGGVTLYLVNGAWTTTKPAGYQVAEKKAAFADFTIDGVGATQNHVHNGTFYQVTLNFDGSELAFNQHASAVSGMTFNGVPMTCGGAPSGDSIMVITLGKGLWVHYTNEQATAGYKGYSHPTIHFEDGARVTDANGKTVTYAEFTLYLVDGAWTSEQPAGYHVEEKKASFVDFTIDGVGATQNHVHNGAFYQLTLDFDYGSLAFNQHASAVSGITFNGVPMTCGGAPSGDSIMVITLGAGLWVHYTNEQAAAGYKNYSHPTIHFEDGATVTDVNGKTVTYTELTLYLANGAWTSEQPADYKITEPAKDTTFVALGKTAETNNANAVTLYFADENEWTDDAGTLADKVLLNGVSLSSIGGSATKGERSVTLAWTGEYTTLTIDKDATFAGHNIPQMTLYLNDSEWLFIDGSKEATVSCFGPASGAWDNVENEEGYSSNVFKFSANFADSADKINQASNVAYPVATGIKINGVSFYELYLTDNKTTISYEHGYNYLYFMVAKEYLEASEGEYTILTIEQGTVFMNQVLPACEYILYKGHWINLANFDPNPLTYNGVAPGWNNAIYSGISNNILQFGEFGVNFLGPDNGNPSHADPTNLANPALQAPIATALTIDGKTIGSLYEQDNRVQVSYAHGYNYFYISLPEYMLSKEGYGCVTLHIEAETVFMGCVLPEVTLYLYEGEWTNIKPDVVEGEDAEYTTITQLFGEATKTLSGAESAESAMMISDSVIYSFLLKNDSIENTVMFSTHYTTEFDGIKVVFIGDASTGNERVLLFVNGEEVANASYLWTANEWFAVRIAVDVAETLSVSVAIDGVYLIRATELSKDALGGKVGVQNDKGNNAFADYKAGDIKKPILYWQGKDIYRYEVGVDKPADSVFQAVIDIMDNKDGVVNESTMQVIWQDGAVTDGKLNEGVWTVTLSVSDTAGNIAQLSITVVVADADRAVVTFDGVVADTIYHIGDLLAEPEDPVKEGYTFAGWYVGDRKWDFVNDAVTGDLALTAKFIRVETTYTIVITSEGLANNYVYTFKLADGAVLDQTILVRDGYIYKLYAGDTEVKVITVDGDANYKAVYTEVQEEPDDSSSSSDDSVDNSQDSSDVATSGCNGCSGVVSFSGAGCMLLITSVVMLIKKRKED